MSAIAAAAPAAAGDWSKSGWVWITQKFVRVGVRAVFKYVGLRTELVPIQVTGTILPWGNVYIQVSGNQAGRFAICWNS